MARPTTDKPSVLYVCIHNAGRSQMAAAYTATCRGRRRGPVSGLRNPPNQVNPSAVPPWRRRASTSPPSPPRS